MDFDKASKFINLFGGGGGGGGVKGGSGGQGWMQCSCEHSEDWAAGSIIIASM